MGNSVIQLSKRLEAVTAMVPKCGCVADVGCDHGYSSIFLVQSKIARRAIAMDVRKGPLMRAEEHIRQRQLASYIEVRLSDGLKQLEPYEADTVVIAGMGGSLMRRILEEGRERLGEDTVLVLQPQSELAAFRSYLAGAGFVFCREDLVLEDGKYYPMMQVRFGQEGFRRESEEGAGGPFTPEELAFGPLLLKHRHPVLLSYLRYRQGQAEKILRQIREQASGDVRLRRTAELEEELAMIRRGLSRY